MPNLTPSERDQVLAMFEALVELPASAQRVQLDQASVSRAVRAEVESLLAQNVGTAFEDARLGEFGQQILDPHTLRPTAIGPYEIVDVLGEGGMGEVYLAEQHQPVQRRVALKVIKLGMSSREIVARFEQERQSLARMNHEAIAKVYDAGITESGQPYFVMEYVEGKPMTRYCNELGFSVRQRVELMAAVCDGVQHAHQKGVIHRDLKPSNVLVASRDGGSAVKVIDFGLARSIDDDDRDSQLSLMTRPGQLLGTLAYMSPEQARGDTTRIDTRTDVYALGVMLYEILCGERPFDFGGPATTSLDTARRQLEHEDPPKPSTRVASSTNGSRASHSQSLSRMLRGDLDAIVMKAMAKEPERRYESCSALRQDLERYLADEPVLAQPPSQSYRLRKLVRRYRVQFAAASLIALALLIGAGFATGFAVHANEQQEIAETSLGRFNQLAGVVKLREAEKATKTTYPAWPANLPQIRAWLRNRADPLLASVPELERALRELEAQALPQTDEQRRDERAAHPQAAELRRLRRERESLRRIHRVRRDEAMPLRVELDEHMRAMTYQDLSMFAHARSQLVIAEREHAGEEAIALAAARLSEQMASDVTLMGHHNMCLEILAIAQCVNGLGEEAIATQKRAVEEAPEPRLPHAEDTLKELEAAAERLRRTEPERLAELDERIPSIEAELEQRRTWAFMNIEHQFLRETLAELIDGIDRFEREVVPNIREREHWATRIEQLTRAHPHAPTTWDAARDAIRRADGVVASELYREAPIDLVPQVGLVPIGMNPVTKLWEFYHLRSAWHPECGFPPDQISIPQHEPDGSIPIDDGMGIVFVLLPGGAFMMGSQTTDPDAPRYDQHADRDEALLDAQLDPFFIARHELSQGCYIRLTDENPSRFSAGWEPGYGGSPQVTLAHPVEQVDWDQAMALADEYGLQIPTEAQWEYACRAGTETIWWTGQEMQSLMEGGPAANIGDQAALRAEMQQISVDEFPEYDDGWPVHGPVDAGRANAWGFYQVYGNVAEWCRDLFAHLADKPLRVGDGLRESTDHVATRVTRGGYYMSEARYARSAWRNSSTPTDRANGLGIRLSRELRLRDE